ncbi:hypothetical protein ACQPZQ_02510 [Pseudonocardia sp. CA-142604]|uniref:hypothetical protein n=1 Tax=Pseudonocardia sp. CA-142604 TaxID=3240024 RepID=UPI003D8E75CC
MALQDADTRTIDPLEPHLTPDALIARPAVLRGKLRERQDECEQLGRLPDSTLHDYLDAGFHRVMQPRRFGAYEFGLDTFLRLAVELSRGCPSSGWVFALTAANTVIISFFEERGRPSSSGTATFAAQAPRSRPRCSRSRAATGSPAGGTMRPAATWQHISSAVRPS